MGETFSKASPTKQHTIQLVLNGLGVADDEVGDEVIDLVIGLTEDLIPLEGIHCAEEGLTVYGEVVTVGQCDFAAMLGCDADKAVDICHGIESDFVSHNRVRPFVFDKFM